MHENNRSLHENAKEAICVIVITALQLQAKGDWHLQNWKIFSPSFRSHPNSSPSFSTPATSSVIFQSCNFQSCKFSYPVGFNYNACDTWVALVNFVSQQCCTEFHPRSKTFNMHVTLRFWITIWVNMITPWAIKRSQLIFARNFVKNQQISMQFSVLDLKMNGTSELHPPYLIKLLHYLVKVKIPKM